MKVTLNSKQIEIAWYLISTNYRKFKPTDGTWNLREYQKIFY